MATRIYEGLSILKELDGSDHPAPAHPPVTVAALLLKIPRPCMMHYMRMTRKFNRLAGMTRWPVMRRLYLALSEYFKNRNATLFQFEHGSQPIIPDSVVLHHTGVCVTSDAVIGEHVHIYRNVVFGSRNGNAPVVKRRAKIGSNSTVLGAVVGVGSIVAPGAVVVDDVPDGVVVGGVPARVIGRADAVNSKF